MIVYFWCLGCEGCGTITGTLPRDGSDLAELTEEAVRLGWSVDHVRNSHLHHYCPECTAKRASTVVTPVVAEVAS